MNQLNITCPFCNEKLHMDQYRLNSRFSKVTVFCDNDNCNVKPCTDHTNPSAAFADVHAWK